MVTAAQSGCLLPGQYYVRGAAEQSEEPNRVLHRIYPAESPLAVCRNLLRHRIRTAKERETWLSAVDQGLQPEEDRPNFSEVPQPVRAGHSGNHQTDTEVKAYEYRRLY